jgi:type II secretory pathway pseudopilin PulG
MANKKNLTYIIAGIGIIILIALIYFSSQRKKQEISSEEVAQKQLEELNRVRVESNAKEFTEKDIKNQLQEMDRLHQKYNKTNNNQ